MSLPAHLKDLCDKKKAGQQAALPQAYLLPETTSSNVMDVDLSGVLSEKERQITGLKDVSALLAKLRSGEWTSEEVTLAFIKRATVAQQLTNCLTEFWFDEALQTARDLDARREKSEPLGHLHGLPVSLKDQLDVAGKELNMGYASWLGRISKEDAALVTVLKRAGAVLYARTNVPQTLMIGETVNYVYGRTTNPYNREHTSGGSSGGEGALIAFGGSPLGVGSDIGGSIRIPSTYCGLYGLRPTMRRIPYGGATNSCQGLEAISSVVGPMSTSLSGCVEFVKAVMGQTPSDLDPTCIDMPWREEMYQLRKIGGRQAKLSFAFYDFDGVVHCDPPVRRAVAMVKAALEKAGHEVIAWEPRTNNETHDTANAIFVSDGGADFRAVSKESGEPLHPEVPYVGTKELTVYESWQLNNKRDELRKRALDQWLETASQTSTGSLYYGYTNAFNLLDWPALAMPVTQVDPSKDVVDADFKAVSDVDQQVHDAYDPKTFAGLPVGIQLVGRRFREEELLGLAEIVDAALKAA